MGRVSNVYGTINEDEEHTVLSVCGRIVGLVQSKTAPELEFVATEVPAQSVDVEMPELKFCHHAGFSGGRNPTLVLSG